MTSDLPTPVGPTTLSDRRSFFSIVALAANSNWRIVIAKKTAP
jgi:hypothetical protein